MKINKIGIVGHAADKFTPRTEQLAREVIYDLLSPYNAVLVSGHCPLGGVDIWAEEIARELGRETLIFKPRSRSWSTGYKPRNLQIARTSDTVHVIVVREYPDSYRGVRFASCYHTPTRMLKAADAGQRDERINLNGTRSKRRQKPMSQINRIEVSFAVPVELTDTERRKLHGLISSIVGRHQPEGCVHWLAGVGSSPKGVYYLETGCRKR